MDKKEILEFFDAVRVPALSMNFIREEGEEKQDDDSKIGGKPFITKKDEWPKCQVCHKDMEFLLQLNEKSKDGVNILKVFQNLALYQSTRTRTGLL
mgnify:CR=1 FL=1